MREIEAKDLEIGEEFEWKGERFMRVNHEAKGHVWSVMLDEGSRGSMFSFGGHDRVRVDRPVERIALVRMSGEDRYYFDIPDDAQYRVFYLDEWRKSQLTGWRCDRVLYSPQVQCVIELLDILKAHTK